tara:strand:- start:369 stop:1394 length:1026 start_codon:yes stop_codon:yes gene_type:complete
MINSKINYINIYSKDSQGLVEPNGERKIQFQRLPQHYQESLRKDVWELSENSAGVSISFKTNSSELSVKWTVKLDFSMNHMTDVGIKGIDLYYKENGRWDYLSSGIPSGKINKTFLFKGFSDETREYRLHLPLYDSITDLQIGIHEASSFEIVKDKDLPIVFYGTSITQGGCASRPGVAHTNVISRSLGIECINLGFSGNGHMEESLGAIIAEIEAKLIVIECMANVDLETVRKNTIPLIQAIRKTSQDSPTSIVFIEEAITNNRNPDQKYIQSIHQKNLELARQVKIAGDLEQKNVYIISQVGLIDQDSEATIDGTHYNDLGFERHAKHLVRSLIELGLI